MISSWPENPFPWAISWDMLNIGTFSQITSDPFLQALTNRVKLFFKITKFLRFLLMKLCSNIHGLPHRQTPRNKPEGGLAFRLC